MPIEQFGAYEIEYSAVKLAAGCEGWGANLAIFGPASNPMHRHPVFPAQRVLLDLVFEDEKSAEQEARKVALGMLTRH